MLLGAGRETLDSDIDYSVGIVLQKKVGDYVNQGETLALLYVADKNIEEATKILESAYSYSDTQIDTKLILNIVR